MRHCGHEELVPKAIRERSNLIYILGPFLYFCFLDFSPPVLKAPGQELLFPIPTQPTRILRPLYTRTVRHATGQGRAGLLS